VKRTPKTAGAPRRKGGDDVLILCYHAVSEDWPSPLAVTPEQFAHQVSYLAERGYRGVTFTEAALGEPAGKVVAFTFDDGYLSVGELARPILESHAMVGTIYVPTQLIEAGAPLAWDGTNHWLGTPYESELAPLSWAQLRELSEAGWEIGSHALDHPHLPDLSEAELHHQLADSRLQCAEKVGAECTSVAFPYGESDERVLREAQRVGYSAAAMLSSDLRRRSRFASPRIGIYPADSARRFKIKMSPAVRRLRESAVWEPISHLVHSLRRG
jgi:peptidoglycan/xylan/chitin deacetylase (PgdA/CDA1 family)